MDAGVFREFHCGYKLVGGLAQVVLNFFDKLTPIALTSSGDALDVFWVYADSS
ncbi:hypothetical protein [Gelidibacter gilvus]|uniref:hypothetical protein n=1 Tax=Gelidibacter gilvus TaxID=59602 RepID=UPI00167D18CC|nr:hypothetical protein [Gelidibacter gilvus]